MDKIKSIIKKLDLLFNIGFWISLSACGASFISIFYAMFDTSIYNETHFMESINTFTFGMLEFVFNEGIIEFESNKILIILSLCLSFFATLLTTYCIYLVRKVFKAVLEDTLFSDTVVSQIQELAITLVVVGTVVNVASYVDFLVLNKSIDIDSLFIGEKITYVFTHFDFNYSYIIIGIAVYLFSVIFQYGVELQKLSDETI